MTTEAALKTIDTFLGEYIRLLADKVGPGCAESVRVQALAALDVVRGPVASPDEKLAE